MSCAFQQSHSGSKLLTRFSQGCSSAWKSITSPALPSASLQCLVPEHDHRNTTLLLSAPSREHYRVSLYTKTDECKNSAHKATVITQMTLSIIHIFILQLASLVSVLRISSPQADLISA